MGTIGAVSDLVEKVRANWTANAARLLYELELKSREIRDKLEHGDIELAEVDHMASELNSYVMSFITLVDRDQGLKLAGIK
jgi:hypothetical protein